MEPNLTAAKKGGLRYNTCSMLHMNCFLFLKGRWNDKFFLPVFFSRIVTSNYLRLLNTVRIQGENKQQHGVFSNLNPTWEKLSRIYMYVLVTNYQRIHKPVDLISWTPINNPTWDRTIQDVSEWVTNYQRITSIVPAHVLKEKPHSYPTWERTIQDAPVWVTNYQRITGGPCTCSLGEDP